MNFKLFIKTKLFKENIFIIFIVFIMSLLALWPFFRRGFFESHDGEWMIIRFSAFHQTLVSGQFPVRFVDRLNNNYGYSVLNFLYPAPFYFSEIFKISKVNFVNSVKLTFIITTIASSILMFWALSRRFSKMPSLAGALIYLYSPYRFIDLFVRGSIGENMAFAALPLILGSIFQIEKGKKIFFPVLSVSIAFLITSHNVIAAIFLPIIIIYSALLLKKEILPALLSILLGTTIAAFFWIPALYDLQYVRLSQIAVADPLNHLVNISDLLIPKWGYGPIPTQSGGFSTQLGIISMLIFLISILFIFKKKSVNRLMLASLSVFFFSALLLTKYSALFWKILPLVGFIQFPWRLLSLIVFTTSILAAITLENIKNKFVWSSILIIIAILTTISYTKPVTFVDRGDTFYSTNEDTTTSSDEYLPTWVKVIPTQRANEKFQKNVNVQIQNSVIKPAFYEATLNANQASNITVNTIYFPGFAAKINGQKTAIDYNNEFGLINIQLPKGISKVIIKYEKTPVHLLSEILSLLSILITGILFYKLWQKQKFW